METQLLQAIDIAHGGVQNVQNPGIVQEALAYLEQVKENKEQVWSSAWNVFAARDERTNRPAHNQGQRLFCLTLVISFLEDSLSKVADPAGAVAFLQNAALQHIDQEYVAGSGEDGVSFMLNKFAQFLSSLLVQTYGLPPPFTLLPNLLARMHSTSSSSSTSTLNPTSTDMILRLLHEVSISLGSDATLRAVRSRERISRDSVVKDEIRASHAADIANSVWRVIEESLAKVDTLSAQGATGNTSDGQGWTLQKAINVTCEAITVVGDYASWIDISLVVTVSTVELLYRLLQHHVPSLRTAATDALAEIVAKGMDAPGKLELLGVLNLTSSVSQLEKRTRGGKDGGEMLDEEVAFREHLAKLANAVSMELAKVLEGPLTVELRSKADKMLLTHMELVLNFLTDEWDELAEAVLPCIGATLTIYKKLKKVEKAAASGSFEPSRRLGIVSTEYTQEKADLLARLMDILLIKMKFDDDTEWNGGGGKGGTDDDEEDSEEEEIGKFIQLRKQLQQNAAAIAGIDESIFSTPTQRLIMETLIAYDAYLAGTGPPVTWQRAEVALFVLYFCGEVYSTAQGQVNVGVNAASFVYLPADVTKAVRNKPPEGFFLSLTLNPLGEMVQRFYQCKISAFRQAAVQLQYFECSVRYAAFLTARPDSLTDALAPFLDWRGMHNERPSVRHRAQYLFLRFIKETKKQFQPAFVQSILQAIQDLLVIDAKLPAVDPQDDVLEEALKKSNGFDHQMNLFETYGVLLNFLKDSPDQQQVLLRALAQPLSKQLADAVQKHQSNQADLQAVLQIHHLFLAMANVAKGFPDLSGNAISRVNHTSSWMIVFKEVTEQILSALGTGTLNNFRIVRDAARGAVARMVATTGPVVLPYIPSLLNALLSQVSASELMDFLSFLGMVASRYKTEVEAVIDELLSPLLEKIFYFLNQDVTGTDDHLHRQQLLRGYFSFLSTLLGAGLDDVLRSSRNQSQLETVLQSLVFYSKESEAVVMRQIFNILARLVQLWGGRGDVPGAVSNGSALGRQSPDKPLPGFENFMYETLAGLIFEVPGKPDFDFQDAQTQIALTEICNLLKAIHTKRGQEFIDFLSNIYFPGIKCPPELAGNFIEGLERYDEGKPLRMYLEYFVKSYKAGHGA